MTFDPGVVVMAGVRCSWECLAPTLAALPVGDLTVSEQDGAIVSVDWGWGRDQEPTDLLRAAVTQLQEYFDGDRQSFALPLNPPGTAYQRRVWQALCRIPPGETRTYADIARQAGGAARSVGRANGANPIPILIPCHRVIASSGLGGYSGDGGLATKLWLLELERRCLPEGEQLRRDGPTTPMLPGLQWRQ